MIGEVGGVGDAGDAGAGAGEGGVGGAAAAVGGMPAGRRRGAGMMTCSMLGVEDGVCVADGNGSPRKGKANSSKTTCRDVRTQRVDGS